MTIERYGRDGVQAHALETTIMTSTSTGPMLNAFSHRDDEQARPLADAFELGFRFIEMDVWYVFGRLLVAHDLKDLRPSNTLQRLYLDPLRAMHRVGEVTGRDPVWLFVDTKTRADPMHDAVERLAHEYDDLVAEPTDRSDDRPVRLILTGNRPAYERVRSRVERRAALDGRLSDVGVRTDVAVMPVISDHWPAHFSWRGAGRMPDEQRSLLRDVVAAAHASGQRLRFWETPDAPGPEREALWTTLIDEGVDLVNTDDLHGLASFLRGRGPAGA